MGWRKEFPEYEVPPAIDQLVDAKYVKDTSRRWDPAPSFSAPLKGRRWLRLWVEHPKYDKRRGGPKRYRLEVTWSLKEEGVSWIETNKLSEAIVLMISAITQEGFRMAGTEAENA